VVAGLAWLAEHQNRDGSWSFNHSAGDKCSGFPDPAKEKTKIGATGLALSAFLVRGHWHLEPDKYAKTVKKGLIYLQEKMDHETGRLYESNGGPRSHLFSHAMATSALVEAYGLSYDKELAPVAQKAVDYIVNASCHDGGWRYLPNEPSGDVSSTGWQVMALKNAKLANLKVPDEVYAQAMQFLDRIQEGQESDGAKYRYMISGGQEGDNSSSAVALFCRTYLGWKKDHASLKEGMEYISARGPDSTNMYFDYYATMFLYRVDGQRGEKWRKWNLAMREQLIESQATKGGKHLIGSWHIPAGEEDRAACIGDVGGRVFDTALAVMTLEVYYRCADDY